MPFPIEASYVSGSTLYAIIHHPDGRVWNDDLAAWEAFNGANWEQYAVPLTEQGAAYYRGTFPAGIEGVLTTEAVYWQGGGAPATTDALIAMGQSQGVNVDEVKGSDDAASNFLKALLSEKQGAVIAGSISDRKATTDLTDAEDDVYVRRAIIFTSGQAIRMASIITGYDAETALLTWSPPTALPPEAGDTFIIV